MDNIVDNKNDIIFYEDENSNLKIEVLLNDEDVWLNTNAIAELFGVQRPAIVKHINNIYKDEELKLDSTCSILEHVGNNGTQSYKTKYYNSIILSLWQLASF